MEEMQATKAYVFLEKDDKVLFVRDKGREDYKLPGGRVEKGERIIEGALREVREETGYETTLIDLVGMQNYISKKGDAITRFYFRGSIVGGEETVQVDEIEEIRWLSREEIMELARSQQMLPQYVGIVHRYLENQRFPLSCIETVDTIF